MIGVRIGFRLDLESGVSRDGQGQGEGYAYQSSLKDRSTQMCVFLHKSSRPQYSTKQKKLASVIFVGWKI